MEYTFKQYMKEKYTLEELQDIARYGCQGGVSGMIYYEETTDLYFAHSEELHQMLGDYETEFGEYPQYIIKNLGDGVQFRNAVVWFCAEVLAQSLVNELEEV